VVDELEQRAVGVVEDLGGQRLPFPGGVDAPVLFPGGVDLRLALRGRIDARLALRRRIGSRLVHPSAVSSAGRAKL